MRYLEIYPIGSLMHDILGVILFRVSTRTLRRTVHSGKLTALAPPNGAALVEL